VVGVDGSPASLRALHWAAAEAARRDAGLDVVHAWMTPYPLMPTDVFKDPAPFEARGWEIINHALAALAPHEHAPFDVRPVLVEDYAAKALLRAAKAAELLVVGSRGRGGFSGLLLGSVSQHSIQQAPCPIAVIPHAWTGSDQHGRVVVGVDGSDHSRRALRWAIGAAALRDAVLDVVHAYDYMAVVMPIGMAPGIDRETLEKESRKLLEQMVEPELRAASRRPVDATLVPEPASAARALIDTAIGADLLVVGSRGRGGVRGLIGSVSQQCVHHAPCPVVVVRGAPDQDRQPDKERKEE
jgi:nucleotide-binding universal stress UspA family protein